MSDKQPPKSATSSTFRHDFCTPIHQIIGYSQMLQEDLQHEEAPATAVADLQKIETAAQRLLALVNTYAPPLRSGEAPVIAEVTPVRHSRETTPASIPLPATLLVVDDEEMNRDMLSRRFVQRGYTALTAGSGREALEIVKSSPPDLILLDVMMPEMTGLDVLVELRAAHTPQSMPVIMATARDSTEDIVEALRIGANDYVTKPIDFDVVLARVNLQLSLKRANEKIQDLYRRLNDSQDRIAKLMSTAAQAVDDVTGWCARAIAELTSVVGAQAGGVWLILHDQLSPITATPPDPGSLEQILSEPAMLTYRDGLIVVRVLGLSGAPYAVIVFRHTGRLNDLEERLVLSLAHQLGGALEVRHTREALSAAQELNRARKQAMLASGVDLLMLCPVCGTCYDQNSQQCENDQGTLITPRLLPYRVAGRYRLQRILGQGGMGTVFQAFDERLERAVALKVINAEHFNVPSVRLRFEREAHALARVAHPSVIALYDSGELEDGAAFFVMELLSGCDLRQLLQRCGRGTPAQVARLLRLCASGLAAAHRAGVIHRDVKPPNILVTGTLPAFSVKIVDFGVAKPISGSSRLTESGMLIGTPAYMAPEQLGGKDVDARTDTYALAAVIYEALVGHPITRKTDLAAIIVDVLHNAPASLSAALPEIPQSLDEAFRAALALDPTERPADIEKWASAVADVLENIGAGGDGWTGDLVDIGKRRSATTQYLDTEPIADTVASRSTIQQRP